MTCRHLDDGICTQGLWGGRPEVRHCEACNRYDGPDRGLGDTVHRAIVTIGGAKIAKREGCGCGRRRAALNRLLPKRTT